MTKNAVNIQIQTLFINVRAAAAATQRALQEICAHRRCKKNVLHCMGCDALKHLCTGVLFCYRAARFFIYDRAGMNRYIYFISCINLIYYIVINYLGLSTPRRIETMIKTGRYIFSFFNISHSKHYTIVFSMPSSCGSIVSSTCARDRATVLMTHWSLWSMRCCFLFLTTVVLPQCGIKCSVHTRTHTHKEKLFYGVSELRWPDSALILHTFFSPPTCPRSVSWLADQSWLWKLAYSFLVITGLLLIIGDQQRTCIYAQLTRGCLQIRTCESMCACAYTCMNLKKKKDSHFRIWAVEQ